MRRFPLLLLTACGPLKAPAPATVTDIPSDVTGFTGTVSWTTSVDDAVVCTGISDVVGTARGTFNDCPDCDFIFDVQATAEAPPADGCAPAALGTWIDDPGVDIETLQHWRYDPGSWFGYDYGHDEAWALIYSYYETGYYYAYGSYGQYTSGYWYESYYPNEFPPDGVVLTEEGATIPMPAAVQTPTISDWWTYCADNAWAGAHTSVIPGAPVDGLLTAAAPVGDVWTFPVVQGANVVVRADETDGVASVLRLYLAQPEGCLVAEAYGDSNCGTPGGTCPSLSWTASATGDVRVAVAAASGHAGAYALGVQVSDQDVTPTLLGDDVSLYASGPTTTTTSSAALTWTR